MAAAVVLIAGAAKLRTPGAAADALLIVGVGTGSRTGRAVLVRIVGVVEVAVAAAVITGTAAAATWALAGLYGAFSVTAVRLARAHASCGCFGAAGAPAGGVAVALNLALGTLCLAGGLIGIHGGEWILERPAAQAPVLAGSILAAAAATVLAYTELPRAWRAWSGG